MATTTQQTLAEKFTRFLNREYKDTIGTFVQERAPDHRSVIVDWMDIYRWDRDLAEDLLDDPKTVRPAANQGLRTALKDLPVADEPEKHGPVYVRFTNVQDRRGTDACRSQHIGDFFELEGQVSKVSQIAPKLHEGIFECQRCATPNPVPQTSSGDIQEPGECQGCGRKGPYVLLPDRSNWIDRQMLRVQQPPEETLGGQGAYLDVILSDDAVVPLKDGRLKPGNRVSISGRYTVRLEGKGTSHHFEGDYVHVEETDYTEINISRDETELIESIARGDKGDPYDLLVDSLSPTHHGDDHIKLALTLQMFRGVRSQRPDGSWTRGDSHILLLGDPGVGKSSLLRRVADIAPRSAYASGKGASAAGMTAAAVPSDFGDEKWDVQAGVLVLATGGLACVDEIDKVNEDAVSSMHDALEAPQVVEVDKADIHTTLPAQTSLLAAGNPKHGRFDDHGEIGSQIDISPTLLSRFDLMFLMRDQPDEERDRELADSIISGRQEAVENDHRDGSDDAATAPSIDENLLRKYIAYTRQNYFPKIETRDVADAIADRFIQIRSMGYERDSPVPVTPRKLEAMLRLVEASARIRCSNTVNQQDVDRVSQLLMRSLAEIGMNDDGQIDADIIETGTSKSQRERIRTVRRVMIQLEKEYDLVPEETLLEELEDSGIDEDQAEYDIAKLKTRGELYAPKSDGRYKLVD